MNEWSIHRKRLILLILLTFLVVIIGVPSFLLFSREPNCYDGRQNGSETGVDCGGACQLICATDALPILLKGDPRVLVVAPGVYEVVAILENPNATSEVLRARYSIRLFESSRAAPVKVIEGEVYVPRGSNLVIFEGPFTLDVLPSRAVLTWDDSSLVWQRSTAVLPELQVRNKVLSKEDTEPRLEGLLDNLSLGRASNVELTALISDEDGNLFAASKTFVDVLLPGQSVPVIFTWPSALDKQVASTEIVVRILPDRSYIR